MYNYTKVAAMTCSRIKSERERLGVEKKEFAAALGYGLSNYAAYETKTLPSIERLVEMADYFGCSVDYLLGRSNVRENTDTSRVDNILAIMNQVLDRYRNSITRKAFIQVMEAVVAEVSSDIHDDPELLKGGDKDEPLTLDELRQMEGEPVWMAPVQKTGWISVPAQWTIFAGVSESISREPVYVFSTPRTPLEGMGGSYGQTWLAYRRKPKNTTEG